MIKRMNKRGQQEGMGLGTLLALIIGVIAIVIIILFVTGGFDTIKKLFGFANIDITALSQKCDNLISFGGAYCTERHEIAKDTYVNCDYAVKNYGVNVTGSVPTCDNDADIKSICNKLRDELGTKFNPEKIKVNGQKCLSQ